MAVKTAFHLCAALACALALAGCRSYEVVQSNIFSDDDGNVVSVSYGRSERVHTNTFQNPTNGKTLEFKTKLVVEVVLPDGDSFTAWQCMNFMQTGTMYRTDNEDWMILVNGFTCRIYRNDDDGKGDYREVYRGVLCETPERDAKKDDRWRSMKKDSRGRWR